ncbi:MAG: hypothetical protein LBF88_02950, partial [Planctomycetaceae bacterium]|nr:hypothetical protein [Planctomycetaceae bacterium]
NWFFIVRENCKDQSKLEKYADSITRLTEKANIEEVKIVDNVIKVYQGNIPDELKKTDNFFKYYAAVKDAAR